MRRFGAVLGAVMLAGVGVPATTASAAAPDAGAVSCEAGWGSASKSGPVNDYTPLVNIRAGQHECYDRLVFDIRGEGGTGGEPIGYRVGYVDKLHQDGSGRLIPVGGGAILEIRVAAPSYDAETGGETYPGRVAKPLPGVRIDGYRTFKDTRFAGSFEGDTQVGLGVRARLPFRVVQASDRLIVDVAHSWSMGR
ncbi:AMIN-like domain-containing (lipo)protein [Streptomyces sp. NPDC002851]